MHVKSKHEVVELLMAWRGETEMNQSRKHGQNKAGARVLKKKITPKNNKGWSEHLESNLQNINSAIKRDTLIANSLNQKL